MNTLSGHMIVKNGIKFDYPFRESCLSVLPICDEFIFIEGYGEDGTYEAILELQKEHPKIKVFREPWVKKHYSVLSDLTNVAIQRCQSVYHFQVQADEVLHENYHRNLKHVVNNTDFDYASLGVIHFYSNFQKLLAPHMYYNSFIRIARCSVYPNVRSYDDAMSLGCPNCDSNNFRKLTLEHFKVHHYGYVRTPMALIKKQDEMFPWWGFQERDALFEKGLERGHINWSDKFSPGDLPDFTDTHPEAILKWIEARQPLVESGSLDTISP